MALVQQIIWACSLSESVLGLSAAQPYCLYRSPFLDSVHQNPIGPCDRTSQIWTVVEKMNTGDAKILQGSLHVQFIWGENVFSFSQVGRCRFIRWVSLVIFNASHPVACHHLYQSEAVHRNRPQEALNDLLAGLGHIGRNGIGALQDTSLQSLGGGSLKWHCCSHHKIKQNSQGPDICVLSNIASLFEKLRRCIRWRATECVKYVTGAATCAKAKVPYFNAVCVGVKHILSL